MMLIIMELLPLLSQAIAKELFQEEWKEKLESGRLEFKLKSWRHL